MAFNKKPGVTIAIGVGKKPGEGPPRAPKGMADAPRFPGEEEAPEGPEDQDDAGGRPYPDPEDVGFRHEGETCEACEYDQGGHCTMLNIPIGLTCSLFEGKDEDQAEGESGMDDEGMEDQQ